MKTFALLIVLFAISFSLCADDSKLFRAICQVESSGGINLVGDNGRSVGPYQLQKIYVDDVNRISGKKFSYNDRWDKNKSEQMMKIYIDHYSKAYQRKTGYPATDEVKARIHNGGPNGWKKSATLKYWNKVKTAMGR